MHRGPALLERIRPFTSPRTQGKIKESFLLNGSDGSFRSSSSSSSSSSANQIGSLQQPSASAGAGAGAYAGEDACAASFDPVAMTADRGASFLNQVIFCHNRSVVQQYRQATSYALEMGVGSLAGGWLSGVLVSLGFGWVYVGYTVVKLAVIIGAHSAVRWDQWLYRHRVLQPLAWLLERTISTPATHFAHHLKQPEKV